MSLHRFFLDDQVIAAEADEVFPLRLSDADARHARVLRLGAGEHLAVVDAASDYFECEVVRMDGGYPEVRVARRLDAPEEGPSVLLVQGLAKGDKMDEVVRHATELGVAGFLPLSCARSVVKLDERKAASRVERWRAVARSAAMQSGQPRVPEVCAPATVAEAAAALAGATAVLVCWEEAPSTARLADALRGALADARMPAADARVAVVVGPEGGLAPDEVEALLACNPRASLVSLGPSILRTETAGVVAPALVLYELGALGGCAEAR
ncbi:RsmE family RNA methyltransferase [Adlercreutzia faecimuris]|uniref:Ribosomal RNA small subunit methyltransferase E n=1 Tax=Adlercreutzia faecimuris TaxID=2897341 RepID=A0ABS9WHG3_9ACTN|nr:RsmE family RNA methyltransferase [Adlercreutzia sp. JBNU-10]MCI2241922.1 16S rRNA (uracil(1498)-N(3))-methyltransferase [Adlercreutzia sp. JBNU-10]